MRILLLSFFVAFFVFSVSAQNEYDALRYSGSDICGSARVQGVGGAFSAVGADMGAATLNPAGMGLYQYSDFSITGRYSIVNNNASYLGKTQNAHTQSFNLPSVGYVYHKDTDEDNEEKKLKGFTYSFGYNQLDNFKRDINASAYNPHSSISDFFVAQANGSYSGDIEYDSMSYAGLAFYTYAIDTLRGSTTQYFPAFNKGRLQQDVKMIHSGNRGEWFFNMATNHQNKLYLGATLGLQSLSYNQQLTIKETDINQLHQTYQNNPNTGALEFPITSLTFKEAVRTSGSGASIQAGAIYRPFEAFRIGLSVKSPTFYNLTDTYSFSVETNQQRATQQTIKEESPAMTSQWKVANPFVATVGLMYLFGKHGFVSADLDYKDYSTAKLSSRYAATSPNYYSYNGENENIHTYFQQAINYRFGGELRLGNFRLRAGAAMMGNGLKSTINQYQDSEDISKLVAFKPSRKMYTFGAGYRSQALFIDLAIVNQQIKSMYHPYTLTTANSFTPTVLNTTGITSIVITTGASF